MVTLPYRERHQGTHLFQEIHVSGDVTIDGNLTFGNTATDDLILKGRMSSMTLAGAAISLGATYTYGEGIEMRWSVASWAGIGSSFRGVYYRASNDIAGASNDIYGMELYSVANNVNTGNLKGLLSYAYIKGASAKTILTAYGSHSELSWDAGAAATTITTEVAAGLFKITGGNLAIPDAAKVSGVIIRSGDMDGSSRTYGNAILIEDDSGMAGTITWTVGLNLSSPATTGIKVAGATTDGLWITGNSTRAINVDTGTIPTGIRLAATMDNGLVIGACTTDAVSVTGTCVSALDVIGATTTAVNISGNSTTAISVNTGTFTTGLALAGTLTTGISVGAATTGLSFTGAVTDAISVAGTSTSIIRATGAATNLLSFDAVEGCVSTQAGGTATYSHKLAVNIDGVGTVYIPLAASFA